MNLALNKANIFMAASWIGLSGLLLTGSAEAPWAPQFMGILGVVILIASSFVMLCTRRTDEYAQVLLNAGASVAFAALLVQFLLLPFAEGLFDGVTGDEHRGDFPAILTIMLAIGAFYIGLFCKRLPGDG